MRKMPRGGVLARFIGPGVGVSNFLFAQGGEEFAHQEIARGFCRGRGGRSCYFMNDFHEIVKRACSF